MREDMEQLLVGRARLGSWRKSLKTAQKLDPRRQFDEDADTGPSRTPASMGRFNREGKEFKDHLRPLHRFLLQSVGRRWNDVYREIRAQVDARRITGFHLLQHLNYMVAEKRRMGTPFFVDSRTGILRDASHPKRRGKPLPMVTPLLLFVLALQLCAPAAQADRTVHGVVALFAADRLMLVLDRDAGPGLPVNTTLTFVVNAQTKVFDRERASTTQALQPDQEATVAFADTRSGLVAREIRILGKHDYSKASEAPAHRPPTEPPVNRPSRTTPPPARGREQTVDPEQLAKLTEVRLQSSDRQGAPAIDRVKAGTDFFIAFYVQVNARTPFRLAYQCQRPDFSTGGMKVMPRCNYEERIPAGFRGVKYRAVPMRYEREANSAAGKDVIAAEVAPIVSNGGGAVIPWQRKLAPVSILP